MRVSKLIEVLNMMPDDMEVMVQTCEGDLLSPLDMTNVWVSKASYEERYSRLNQPFLAITAFIKGQPTTDYSNNQSGVMYMEKPEPNQPTTDAEE